MKKAIAMFILVSSSFAYAEPVRLKAGDKIFFPNSAMACDSRENLKTATLASLSESAAEQAKVIDLFGQENGDGRCLFIGPSIYLIVLRTEYNSLKTPNIGLIEVTGDKSGASRGSGAWALTVGAVRR